MTIIISIVIVFLVLGGVFAFLMKIKGKVNSFKTTKYDKSENEGIKNTQDLLPFDTISRNRIDLGNYHYVAYIKIKPFNYVVRSTEGKDGFAIRLKRSINSIPFRIQFFTHTKKMTNDKMLKNLATTIEKSISDHPDQREYAEEYYDHMAVINVQNPETGALRKVKDYYIVVPWEPSEDHNGMNDEELKYVANDELKSRVRTVLELLRQADLQADFLSTEEILDLFIDIYHRDENNRADLVFDSSYLSMLVGADNDNFNINDNQKLSSILEGTLAQLNQDIIDNQSADMIVRKKASMLYDKLSEIKSKVVDKTKK